MCSQRAETDPSTDAIYAAAGTEPDYSGKGISAEQTGRTAAANAETEERLRQSTEFNIAVDIIYHRSRQAFLLRMHRWAMFGTIIGGAIAASDLVGTRGPAILGASCGALDLVFDWSGRAAVHGDIVRELTAVIASLHRRDFDRDSCQDAVDGWIRVSAAEPAIHHVARDLAFNQAIVALGRDDEHWVAVPWNRWLLANFLRFEGTRPSSRPKHMLLDPAAR